MTEPTNRYDLTAARAHGRPGRDIRPRSLTVDIHSHVLVPAAAAYVRTAPDAGSAVSRLYRRHPYPDPPAGRGPNAEPGGPGAADARLRCDGGGCAGDQPGSGAVLLRRAARGRHSGGADGQRGRGGDRGQDAGSYSGRAGVGAAAGRRRRRQRQNWNMPSRRWASRASRCWRMSATWNCPIHPSSRSGPRPKRWAPWCSSTPAASPNRDGSAGSTSATSSAIRWTPRWRCII